MFTGRFILCLSLSLSAINLPLRAGESAPEGSAPVFHPSLLTGAARHSGIDSSLEVRFFSPGKAFLMSFAVPGAGELRLGSRKMAVIFFSTEVVLWSSYFLLQEFGGLRADDYRLYAAAHAGVSPGGKNHQFFVDVENHSSLTAYNEAMLQERRPEAMYPENGTYQWSWDNEKSMEKFKRIRIESDRFKNAGQFVIGGVILNHLVSGIDAMRIARKQVKALNPVHASFYGLPEGGFQVVLWKCF
jgi:hypothetical protein